MEIKRNGSRPSSIGPAENFTGHARRDAVFIGQSPSRLSSGSVTFAPGARTVWHTHPVGQLLIITQGRGLIGTWGGETQMVQVGDVVWFEPLEKHWHGAGVDTGMSHLSVNEMENGIAVDWLEPVTDDQYKGQ